MDITIMQGDSYYLPIEIKINDTVLTDIKMFDEIEIMIGKSIRKTLSEGSLMFNQQEQTFNILLTQQNTMSLNGTQEIQIRVKLKDSQEVIGKQLGTIHIIDSLSKEVL